MPWDVQLYLAVRIFFNADFPRLSDKFLTLLRRADLWLFPPSAFISAYITTTKFFPPHPIKIIAVLATAFMFATLTLFLIRPARRKQTVRWSK
jgi:hypothetical protein